MCVTGLSRWGLEIDEEEFDGVFSIDLKLCLHVTHGHMHHKQRPLCSSSEIFGVMECICVFVCVRVRVCMCVCMRTCVDLGEG